jgi:hypothetical protein
MRQHTPHTYGADDEPWEREESDPDEGLETVIVEGTAMSYRSYRRRGGRAGGP